MLGISLSPTIRRKPSLLFQFHIFSYQSQTPYHHPNPPFKNAHNEEKNLKEDHHPDSHLLQNHSNTISRLLKVFPDNPSSLQSALDQTSIQPYPLLIHTVLQSSQFSPKPIHTLYLWATKHLDFQPTPTLFNSIIDLLAKARQFASAWSLLIPHLRTESTSSPVSIDTFAIFIRRYARTGAPQSAIRAFEFMESLGPLNMDSNADPVALLMDALCKEGHVNAASCYFQHRRESDPSRVFSVRIYNILLNGYFRSRKLSKAEKLYEEMRRENVKPTVVTFGTLVEGYCRMRRVEKATELLSEMKLLGVEPNMIVYNPVIDALGEARRFKEALGMVEKLSVHGLSPNISTFNSLVKGFCKAGDLAGASNILKMMMGRGCMPTSTTYNYFFGFFAKFGKIEEGMNLYRKIVKSGYDPDRLTYHLLIKMLCKCKQLDLAVQVIKEMNTRGCDSDLASCTMLVHLLCELHRLEEACTEFEGMIKKGLAPQFITYQMLTKALKRLGLLEMAHKLSHLMDTVPHSRKLPGTYRDGEKRSREEKFAILQKAKVMSDALKSCRDPRELSKRRGQPENLVASANHLIADIQKKILSA